MDIDAALRELRSAIKDYHEAGDDADRLQAAEVVVEQAEAIDSWSTRGGFPPEEWVPELEGVSRGGDG